MDDDRMRKEGVGFYFVIACVPPWIGWSLLVFRVVPEGSPISGALFLTGESVSVAGLVATFWAQGRAGVVRLLRDALRVKVSAQWWLFACLVPLISFIGAGVLYLALHNQPVVFRPSALLMLGTPALLIPFLFGPLGEEFGWRGFLLPRFVKRFSAVPACFFVGTLWALWHWPLFYKAIIKSPAAELFFLLANVTSLSFLVGAVYLRTKSLLLAMISHWSSNAAQTLVSALLPGLPADTLNVASFKWCVVVLLAVAATMTLPLLRTGISYETSPQRK
jgi:membrane protease YdiL (CAAX protease family)